MKTGYIIKCNYIQAWGPDHKTLDKPIIREGIMITEDVFATRKDAFNRLKEILDNKTKHHHCYVSYIYDTNGARIVNSDTLSIRYYHICTVRIL